jgi:hypothetical protein
MTPTAGNVARHLPPLQEKQMEALYTLRLLKTQSDRLKVLHCINAMVSIQVGGGQNPLRWFPHTLAGQYRL